MYLYEKLNVVWLGYFAELFYVYCFGLVEHFIGSSGKSHGEMG